MEMHTGDLGSLDAAYRQFMQAYPEYARTQALDALRASEYGRLDQTGQVYLDYTGGSLYGESQLDAHMALLRANVYGNPHSFSPTSLASTRCVEQARQSVHDYFNASPDEYVVIFTPNASGSLKLVGEAYPFDPGGCYLLAYDNHNSVNGIREFARARGAQITYIPLVLPDMRLDEARLDECLAQADPAHHHLLAYPAQSNFSGVQHPLAWIERAQARGWDVLLDAAAFVPTNTLDLGRWKPDFVSLSFYKMFGYPTGVGCLLARKSALAKLHRPWFAGGTITVASVQGDTYVLNEGAAAFEDGTLNYLGLPAVGIGLQHLQRIGMDVIHERVRCLTSWILAELRGMAHDNGKALLQIYGPLSWEARGGTVAFNIYDDQGQCWEHAQVTQEAGLQGISLRTGCFCNPGGGETALQLTREEILGCFNRMPPGARMTFEAFRRCVDHTCGGAVRISLGLVSNFTDAYRCVAFIRSYLNRLSGV